MADTNIAFRAAKKTDCRDIAALYRISSDGVADYIWTKLAEPGEDVLDVGQRRYEQETTEFSFLNCTIVECNATTAGMLVAFPMHVDPHEDAGTDPVLQPYGELEEDNSYYICGMAMLPEFRGRGIGTQLLGLAESQAARHGLNKMSLIVFEQNAGAKRLYDRTGYRVVASRPVHPHPLLHFDGDALLMVKTLTGL